MITNREADVLLHTSKNGRYVTDEADVIAMGERGLLFDHGAQRLADGMHYLVPTAAGREALSEWKAAQPPPLKPKRAPRSPAFQAWSDYKEAYGRLTFSEFWKDIWPAYRRRYGV